MNSLQPPFSDIVGESSPVQKAIKLIFESCIEIDG